MTSTGLEARLVVRRGASFLLDVGMVLAPDETAVLLGPSGAGKSTVVASLAGLLPIEEGNISLQGEVLDDPGGGVFRPPEDRHVGVVFQDYLLFPHMSVIENVAFGLRSRRMARRQARRRAGEWLERMGLEGLSDRRPGELSGGQTQRVALARALVAEPAMLLLDEPLSALDTTTRLSLRRTLAEHLDGFTGPRLLITHDPEEAFLLADVIHVIDGGSVTQVGTPDEIRLRPRTSYAADVGGSNLVEGTAAAGIVHTAAHDLHVADHDVSGRVLAAIRPSAISVHLHRPHGSPRNTWPTTIELIEPLGERVRLRTGPPLPLTAEITDDAARTLALGEGTGVWVSVKATEITVQAQPEDTGPGDRCG